MLPLKPYNLTKIVILIDESDFSSTFFLLYFGWVASLPSGINHMVNLDTWKDH
jgi:hypothetical protein